jgi:hypothetical protein
VTLYEQLIEDIAQDVFDRLETAQEEMERLKSPEEFHEHLKQADHFLGAIWDVAFQVSPMAAVAISDAQERVGAALERFRREFSA